MAKYIIDIPEQIAEASADYMKKVGMSIEPYTAPARKNIEDEVWNLAREIAYCMSWQECEDAGMISEDDIYDDAAGVLEKLSYQEAKTRYDAWKKQKDEICVGNEVEAEPGNKACVLYENPDGTQVFVFKADGTAAWWSKCAIHKTGKNHPEIAELLKKMRKEE